MDYDNVLRSMTAVKESLDAVCDKMWLLLPLIKGMKSKQTATRNRVG